MQTKGVVCISQIMAYKDGILQEISPDASSRYEIIATLDRDRRTMRIVIPTGCSMITRRTVERQARSVAKSNMCDLVIEESDKIPAPPPVPVETEVSTPTVAEREEPEPEAAEVTMPMVTEREEPVPEKGAESRPASPQLVILDEQAKSRLLSETARFLGFEDGDFVAALFLWKILVNTIKLDNVLKIGGNVTLQWDDGGALEFAVEDNKELSNLLVLSVLGQKATLIKDIWKTAMNWQKVIKS